MFDYKHAEQMFADHKATLTDLGNIKVLDFQEPGREHLRIRFLFEEDYYKLHITGDLGNLIATNPTNMCYEEFSDFVNSVGYFREKVRTCSYPQWEYDFDLAREYLTNKLAELEYVPEYEFETEDDKVDEILEHFDSRKGLDSAGYDILSEIDPDCFEYTDLIGRQSSGILELYLKAFELAYRQVNNS